MYFKFLITFCALIFVATAIQVHEEVNETAAKNPVEEEGPSFSDTNSTGPILYPGMKPEIPDDPEKPNNLYNSTKVTNLRYGGENSEGFTSNAVTEVTHDKVPEIPMNMKQKNSFPKEMSPMHKKFMPSPEIKAKKLSPVVKVLSEDSFQPMDFPGNPSPAKPSAKSIPFTKPQTTKKPTLVFQKSSSSIKATHGGGQKSSNYPLKEQQQQLNNQNVMTFAHPPQLNVPSHVTWPENFKDSSNYGWRFNEEQVPDIKVANGFPPSEHEEQIEVYFPSSRLPNRSPSAVGPSPDGSTGRHPYPFEGVSMEDVGYPESFASIEYEGGRTNQTIYEIIHQQTHHNSQPPQQHSFPYSGNSHNNQPPQHPHENRPEYFHSTMLPTIIPPSSGWDHKPNREKEVRRKAPWKKIIKVMSTIIPIGILLSALTPRVIWINPNATVPTYTLQTSTYPPFFRRIRPTTGIGLGMVHSPLRQRSLDDDSDAFTFNFTSFNATVGSPTDPENNKKDTKCNERALCELIKGEQVQNSEILKMFFATLNHGSNGDVNKMYAELLTSVKMDNCLSYECKHFDGDV